jgi:hypothetical protein
MPAFDLAKCRDGPLLQRSTGRFPLLDNFGAPKHQGEHKSGDGPIE